MLTPKTAADLNKAWLTVVEFHFLKLQSDGFPCHTDCSACRNKADPDLFSCTSQLCRNVEEESLVGAESW